MPKGMHAESIDRETHLSKAGPEPRQEFRLFQRDKFTGIRRDTEDWGRRVEIKATGQARK